VPWAIAALAVALSGCVEDTVFRDRNDFPAPPSAAEGFVGYSRESEKQTVCGNCHVGHQADWENTAHADAWATLQGSGHAEDFCQGCHTASQLGNVATEAGGYETTQDERYHDVQCESCHGPGLEHVENPESTQPLAPIAVGLDLSVGCGECHNGTHHPYVEEWEVSGHGRAVTDASMIGSDPTHPGPVFRAECIQCHTAQGALQAWGVTANYLEKGVPLGTFPNPEHQPIVCAVCHDPHGENTTGEGGPIVGQLRYPVDVPSEEENLCVKCHHKRSQPDLDPLTQTSRGPHSPEGPLLLGENVGFWFGDTPFDADEIAGTHGTEANPRLCATCHMLRYDVTDELTGELITTVVGHEFRAIPCVDANGLPIPTVNEDGTPNPAAEECEHTPAARDYAACATSGCHGTEDAAARLDTLVENRIENLAEELEALIAQVPSQINSQDGVWTVAEGSNFNLQLALWPGTHVHNPFLAEALLLVSIEEMEDTYGISASKGLVRSRQFIGKKR
jgi:hypothetical protein